MSRSAAPAHQPSPERPATRRRKWSARRRLIAATTATLVLAGAQAVPASTAALADESRGVEIPAFYDPPASLPAENGALVRTEPLPLAISLPSLDGKQFPATATRLMYKSTDSTGAPVAVTGAYLEPAADWDGEAPRPLVALAPGTMGQGDQCAASMGLERPILLGSQTVSVGYEDISIYRLLASGAAVVVTDYVGLGATDRLHTYVNRVDGGHALLDAVRAARAVPGASITRESPVGLYGYSQGGGATASAAELQPAYAPDVPLAGAYAGAPPADLADVMEGVDGSALAAAIGWSVNGFVQSNPELRPLVDRYLDAEGKAALEDMSTMCVGDGIFGYPFAKSSAWTTTGQSLSEIAETEPRLRDTIDAQRIGTLKPTTAVRIAIGTQDDIVPYAQAHQLAVDWCAQGANVTFDAIGLPNLGDGLLTNHFAPLLLDQGNAIAWLTDRLSGEAANPNCASLPASAR